MLLPAPVFAHGLVGRADLPIPEALFAAAAALVLVLSFAALAALWSTPRLQEPRERRLVRLPVAVDVVLGIVGVAAFAAVVYAGLAGTDSVQDNLAPNAVFVALWVGVPCVSLLFGDVFRLLSPWRAIGRAVGWVMARASSGDPPEALPYPERLGRWPAAAGIVFFGVCELCWAGGREPMTLALLGLGYLVTALVGMSLYGVEPWTRNADPFGAYFSLFARLAPFVRRDGVLFTRLPGTGAVGLDPVPGTAALLLVGDRRHGVRRGQLGSAVQRRRAAPPGLLREPGREQGHGARALVRRRPRLHDRCSSRRSTGGRSRA